MSERKAQKRKLCHGCNGNGVINFRNGVKTCNLCDGDGWEKPKPDQEVEGERGFREGIEAGAKQGDESLPHLLLKGGSMYGIKGIRWAIRMAPTPEQTEQIKQYFDKLIVSKGRPSGSGVLFGLHEEHLLTVDEALETFQQAKILEDNWPEPHE